MTPIAPIVDRLTSDRIVNPFATRWVRPAHCRTYFRTVAVQFTSSKSCNETAGAARSWVRTERENPRCSLS